MVFEGKHLATKYKINRALSMQKTFKAIKRESQSCVKKYYHWILPSHNAMKLNVDGAMFHDQQYASVGINL